MTCSVRFVKSEGSVVHLDYSEEPLDETTLAHLRDYLDEGAIEASKFLSVVTLLPIPTDGLSNPGYPGRGEVLFLRRRIEPVPGRWLTFMTTMPLLQFTGIGRFWISNQMVGALNMFRPHRGTRIPAGATVALVMLSDPQVRLDNDCTLDEAQLPSEDSGKQTPRY